MGSAPEHQAANIHNNSLVRAIRRGEAVRPLPPHARSLADFDAGGATHLQTTAKPVTATLVAKEALS